MKKGIIFRSTGSWYDIADESGNFYKGRLRGKFKLNNYKITNPIAVGDVVLFEIEDVSANTAVINDILERKNYILRKSTHKTAHGHLLASNLDQALLIVTLVMPRTSLGFIDRFLVSAESFNIPTILVFNKIDQLTEEFLAFQGEIVQLYESLGYKCLQISAFETQDINLVAQEISGKTSLIAGHSGVGKSTILNQLVPNAGQRTAEISSFANKGTHTTTFAEMFAVDACTYLIDTPGIKELGIMDIEEQEIGFYFPEIKKIAGKCKYYNCRHTREPHCAVIEAVEAGQIALSRYNSYLSMLEGDDNRH